MSKRFFSLCLSLFLLISILPGSPAETAPLTPNSSSRNLPDADAGVLFLSGGDDPAAAEPAPEELAALEETGVPEESAVPEASAGPKESAVPETAGVSEEDAAPESSPAPADAQPTAVVGPAVYPRVIDRITDPSASAGFAFEEDDLLEIWFPPIRDQDCAIFCYQDQVWMLDCGDERAQEQIVPLLKELGIEKIDRLFNTHPHHDHLNGLYAIDAACPVGELLICFPEDSTKHMTAAMEYCRGNGIPVTHFEDETVFSMGDGLVTFTAWMKTDEAETMNDRSAQFMVSYGVCDMLFMADMELRGQKQLSEALPPETLKADILRYPHHGKLGMWDPLFDAVSPSLVIITNVMRGIDLKESTKYLGYRHMPTAYTNMSEYVIHLRTDGNHWLCELVPFVLPAQPSASPEAPAPAEPSVSPEVPEAAPEASE